MICDEIQRTVFKDGSAVLLARVLSWEGTPITRASISAARYSIFALDERDPDFADEVAGHSNVALSPAELDAAIFDTLQQGDPRWQADSQGYNFLYQIDAGTSSPFPVAGRLYRVQFTLTPAAAQDILVRFRLRAV